MKVTFLKLFLICMLKDPKLAEKWTNLAKKKDEERKKSKSAHLIGHLITSLPCEEFSKELDTSLENLSPASMTKCFFLFKPDQ